jgi:hypothetical protein
MAYTQADLDRLDRAIASGELSVWDGHVRVEYRTMSELMTAREHIAQQIRSQQVQQSTGQPARTGGIWRARFTTSRGD